MKIEKCCKSVTRVENIDSAEIDVEKMGNVKGNELVVLIKNLSKKYSAKLDYAVKDINISARKGEIVGLMGANGAGKSTTLKCLTGMLPFSVGEIEICGKSIKTDGISAKKNFGFVTDNHAVFVKMTGFEYLSFMCDVYNVEKGVRAERINELQKCFNLGDKIYNLISSYSHGMKQKICMMGSLIHEPQLWILDEPMVGLDPQTIEAVSKYMKEYAEKGKTILFSSHNVDAVRRLCHRVVIIKNGCIEAELDMSCVVDSATLANFFALSNAENSDTEPTI